MNRRERKSIVRMDESTWRIVDGAGIGMVYSYLLTGTERAVLIDSGLGLIDIKHISDALTSLPVQVVNTHGHVDHISCNHQYDTVYLHPADEAVFREHSDPAYRRLLIKGLLAEAKMPAWLVKLPVVKGMLNRYADIPARDNRLPLHDHLRLDLGSRTLECIATPGHTPGSVCLLDVERRQLFSGDTLCAEGVLLMLSHSASVQIFKESLLRLKSESARFDIVWPAHHEAPLDTSWMDEYILCADQIIQGTRETKPVSSPVGSGRVAEYGRIQISYRPDNILEK